MKSMSLFLLCLSLFILSGCNGDDATPSAEGWNAAQCTDKAADCGVDWYVSFNALTLPENVQVVFNTKVIIDECDPQSYWSMTSTSERVEFKITDYANLDSSQVLKLAIYDMKTCNGEAKVLKEYSDDQKYTIESVSGKKRIYVRRY